MAIIASASETQSFAPAPEGVHQAVCVDIEDLGLIKSPYLDDKGNEKWQHKVKVYWQIGELRQDGKRFVLSKRYTLSLHEKASLRHDLEAWRGRAFSEQELKGFDVESVKDANCLLNVQHRQNADKSRTYANVVSIMPLVKGMPKMAALDYERWVPKTATEPAPPEDNTPDYDDARLDRQGDELNDTDIPL